MDFLGYAWDRFQAFGKFIGGIVGAIVLFVIYVVGVGPTRLFKWVSTILSGRGRPSGWKQVEKPEDAKTLLRQF